VGPEDDGTLRVEGDEEAAACFAASFRRPAPLHPAETR
jgi:hypothetical protein